MSPADSSITEEQALAALKQRDLPGETIEAITRSPALMKSRKVLFAVVAHPRTPRHSSLPRARHLYSFELMQLALAPEVAADVKRMAEELILTRLEKTSTGERLTLARRASARVAAALLCDADAGVMELALANPHLTEIAIVRALQQREPSKDLTLSVLHHPKWSLRQDVKLALLRSRHLSPPRIAELAATLPSNALRNIMNHMRAEVRMELEIELRRREAASS